MDFNYLEKIEALDSRQRLYFYDLFGHFLTVSMRGVLFTEGLADSERVERAKWLNEISHRLTHKNFVMKKHPGAEWTDAEILEILQKNIAKYPPVEADVAAAIELSYGYVLENEGESIQNSAKAG